MAPSSNAPANGTANSNGDPPSHVWEETGGPNWESAVQEDADGRIVVANGGGSIVQAIRNRRRRLEQNDYALKNKRLVRDMIRYVYIVFDASRWMRTKDPVLPPGTRLDVTIGLLQEFIQAYYDENPLSHLGFVLVKEGEAEILTTLSSNTKSQKLALQSVGPMVAAESGSATRVAGGEFSFQNGLEVAGRSLGHQPRHGSREIVVVTAALSTCDPGSILTETLPRLQQANIRVSCFALAAELYICRKVAEETKGSMGVCLDKAHFREWLLQQTVPPPSFRKDFSQGQGPVCDMIAMGFPTRTLAEVPALVHGDRNKTVMGRTAFNCPQCQAKNAELPTDCAVCGLKLVLSPHLARSFHHLFPVPPFAEVAVVTEAKHGKQKAFPSASTFSKPFEAVSSELLISSATDDSCCMACLRPFSSTLETRGNIQNTVILRFACPECESMFCVDCDVFLHESVHNCPGCLSRADAAQN